MLYTINCAAKTASDTDEWNGTAKYLTGVAFTDYLPKGKTNAAIRKINVSVTATGGNCGGSVGTNALLEDGTSDWSQVDGYKVDGTVTTIETPYGVPDDATLQVGVDWINYNTKVTVKIELETADVEPEEPTDPVTPETGYTSDAADLPVNKVAVQKTAVANGTYNERFVMRVAEADIAKASEVVFTLNNGTKTVTYTTTKYYTSLTVNGTKTSAGDGYVLLTLTVKDIPEGVTVTCTNVEIK